MDSSISRLQVWYKMNCDGDWEHSYGIKIDTLDNPGWSLKIDLEDTALEGLELEPINLEIDENDWYTIQIKNNQYVAYGDANKLEFIIDYFLSQIVPRYSSKGLTYEIFEPFQWQQETFYRPLVANLVEGNCFVISEIPKIEYSKLKARGLEAFEMSTDGISNVESKHRIGEKVKCDLKKMFDYPKLLIIE